MIFDKEEILLYYPPINGDVEKALAIRHAEMVKVYLRYFNKLWAEAIKIEKLEDAEALQKEIKPYSIFHG